ncbi:oligosaccharide flippase family protein [Hahella ganghwensis]|uniref:oligosaccharide flippase family protein n=1 Tax=Hahella ganghwensis TaxID=286420 RepID=UPI0003639F8D|nr:oligosaccharide flippase family protein [Hahella ganghwensis]
MAKLAASLLGSSSLSVAAKLFQRIVGFVSMLVLARLLTPEDFAIAALTSIVIYFFDVLSNVGSEQYIIQKKEVSEIDLNTAWTLDILVKSALFMLLVACAPLVAGWYENPDLLWALIVASCVLPINALKNPGLICLKRNLEYNAIFWLSVIQKLVSFAVVMAVAFTYRSYWAMIIGDVIAALVMTLGAFVAHPFRPKFSLVTFGKQWLFSKWMIVKGIVGYARSQTDTFLVSLFFPQSTLGQYHVSRNIVMLPSHNLMMPAIEPLLAAFSNNADNRSALEFQVRVCLLLVGILITPIVAFMWWFPGPIVDTLLGDQWKQSHGIISNLSLIAYYLPFLLVLEQMLIASNRVKTAFVFDLLSLLVVVTGLVLINHEDVEAFALARGLLGGGATILLFGYLSSQYNLFSCRLLAWLLMIFGLSMVSVLIADSLPLEKFPAVVQLFGYGSAFVICNVMLVVVTICTVRPYSEEATYLVSALRALLKLERKQ